MRLVAVEVTIMEMQHVRYFLALCQERNFTRAAKWCGVSQPTVTNAMKRLEQKLGGSLLYRDRSNIRLPALGFLVRPDLARIDQFAAKAKHKARKFLAGTCRQLPAPLVWLPRKLKYHYFSRREHPGKSRLNFPPEAAMAKHSSANPSSDHRTAKRKQV